MRSGFVAGDATILGRFLLYRTYHGCAMGPSVQAASIAAWNGQAMSPESQALSRKFELVTPCWATSASNCRTQASICGRRNPDTDFARRLQGEYNVTVLPGTYLGREEAGINPGAGYVAHCAGCRNLRMPRGGTPHQNSVKNSDNGTPMQDLQKTIDEAFENRANLSPRPAQIQKAVSKSSPGWTPARLRVAEKSTTPGSPPMDQRRRC